MASRKLVRDLFLSRQPLFLHLTSKQVSGRRLQVLSNHGHTYYGYRRFSVFNEFSKKVKGEADRNQEFKQSVKELKEKTEELKGAKEELKVRTKQTTEQLYKHVDGVWTEAEATAKKRALKSTYWSDRWIVGLFSDVSELENLAVSANVKEKISAATEEVKETFGIGKESSESAGTSAKDGAGAEEGTKASPGEEADKQTGTGDTAESFFGKFKSRIPSSNVSSAYQKLKEARVSEMMKKGYDVVKDELYGNTNKRKHLEHTPPPAFSGEISTKTDIVALPSKQSRWSKKWEAFREKMQGHPLFKRFAGLSEPVVTKGQEIAEDMRERWETSDSPIVIKIQDVSDSIFQESDAAASFKEIRRKDPSFSLMDFVAEVQEAVRPVLNAYIKGDIETLKKYCTPEVINRCEAEHKAFQAHGIFFDNKIRFIDNTDPAGIDHQIAQLGPELASTLVIVISKSGGTPETRNGLLEVQQAFREAGLDFAKQGVAITQENSLLDNTARIEGWLARFPMFDWVGGRTSEMSAVGLLPAALQGIDIREMLAGAALMDEANRTTVLRNNPAALLALCWYWASEGVGSKDMVVLPYKDSLLLFSRYLQQLVMESLGKEFDLDGHRVNQGLTVYGNKGSTDQHAYIQQLRDGVHNFFVTFIEVLRDRPPGHDWELEPGVTCGDYLFGMLQGTRSALYANDRESITVTVQEVTPRSVGALIGLYERAVGIYASLVNINAYHQPGVEAGKKAAGEVLALQKRVLAVLNEASCKQPVEPLTIEEVADRCHAIEDIEMIYKIIAHMAANDRALIAEGSCGSPRSLKVFLGECNVDELFA
ncbi:hypothetical protein NC653_004924 [Populus alba x Populus x berolinensis]|uniref:Glucose-6-phosphate isomerase n=1 Tax=Populus alba x Populus x berolinensis TaxID=444605 RepID=A0AAD6WCF2_9ROSI|nr:hypothetical protein NC653_004924 [Populus alba x Populus x berolinensis]